MNPLAAMKKAGVLLGAVFLMVLTVEAAEKPFLIKMATLAPEGSAWMKTFEALNSEVMAQTANRVRLKIYAGGVLGDESDMLRKMHIGQIQAAAFTSSSLAAFFSEMDVFQIPFLFQTYEETDYVLQKMDAFFRQGFADHGYVLLGWTEGGFVHLMSTIPVASLSDLKKAKVWTWEDAPMAKAIFDEAQVSAIPLSVPDVLVGLQTGLVDVVYAPPTGAISLQWFTRVKYMVDVPLAYLLGGVVLKKDMYAQMPPAFQEVLDASFAKHMEQLKLAVRNENQEATRVMQKHGVQILTPSGEQVAEFKRLSDRAMQRLSGHSFSQKVRQEVADHLETYRGMKK
ncbi:MAG: TRAP transporter substrate-binding protein DctP [Desulfobacterales bacterium]|nr:MAG: TRAP transporter substrate-binding protein DctP [Desulfobacterales bacterium]